MDKLYKFLTIDESTSDKDLKTYIDDLEEFVRKEGAEITINQLRNIYELTKDKVKHRDLLLVKPQIAFTLGKQQDTNMREIINIFLGMIDKIEISKKNQIDNFHYFVKSFLHFHKFFHSKN